MTQEIVTNYVQNFLKIVLAITAFMAVSIFNDMRNELQALRTQVTEIRERLSYIEGQIKNSK